MRRVGSFFVGLVILLSTTHEGQGQAGVYPLKGIKKVTVSAVFQVTQGPPPSLSRDRLQTVTELRLRTGGLTVLSAAEDQQDREVNPSVTVSVAMLPAQNSTGVNLGFAFVTMVYVHELSLSPRNGARVPLELWADSSINITSPTQAAQEVERVVGALLDEFLNEWLKANPKQ